MSSAVELGILNPSPYNSHSPLKKATPLRPSIVGYSFNPVYKLPSNTSSGAGTFYLPSQSFSQNPDSPFKQVVGSNQSSPSKSNPEGDHKKGCPEGDQGLNHMQKALPFVEFGAVPNQIFWGPDGNPYLVPNYSSNVSPLMIKRQQNNSRDR